MRKSQEEMGIRGKLEAYGGVKTEKDKNNVDFKCDLINHSLNTHISRHRTHDLRKVKVKRSRHKSFLFRLRGEGGGRPVPISEA